ncbi:MAG: hypothetical protein D6711_18925 [Chloroflexi bacterium]|nr:MAG: hypothetical protein D6711_18925 [Chloroflexota bacterium]
MPSHVSKFSSELRILLRLIQIVAAISLMFGIATLARDTASIADWMLLLYLTWFTLAIVSIEAIFRWLKVGVYTLILATLVVTLVEILTGRATIGGASLGILVAYIIIVYIRPLWGDFE